MAKIVVFSNMYPNEEHPTYGIFVKNQVELMRSEGVEIDVKAMSYSAKGKISKILTYSRWFCSSLWYLFKNKRFITLTHSHYVFPTGMISFLGKKLLKIPYVITVHGGDIDKMAKKHEKIEQLTRKILQQADAVIVVGERLKQHVIEQFSIPEDKVNLVSMGVDLEVFKPMSKIEQKCEMSIPLDESVLLFVGNMIEGKGVLDLLDAFALIQKKYPNAVLHMIGSDKDQLFMDKVNLRIASSNNRIRHHLPKKQTEVADWFAVSDVFVLPSHNEGFGLVALEAMAVGTPVVASDIGGLSYLLADGAGILVKPRDPKALAEGIEKALTEPDGHRATEMKEKVQLHSYEVIAEKMKSIYNSVKIK